MPATATLKLKAGDWILFRCKSGKVICRRIKATTDTHFTVEQDHLKRPIVASRIKKLATKMMTEFIG